VKRYMIFKYVDDLSRNEPRNVGVIVFDGVNAVARFDGEGNDGLPDLRRVRHRITGSHAYREWVKYWRTTLESPGKIERSLEGLRAGDSRVIESLMASSGQEFYLEEGGEILHDSERLSLDAMSDDLFRRLVYEPEPPAPASLRDKSESLLALAGAPLDDPERFQKNLAVTITGPGGEIIPDEISYAVKNGDWHYLQEVPFNPGVLKTNRKEVFNCAYFFQRSAELKRAGAILYDKTDIGDEKDAALARMLGDLGTLIDVSAEDDAPEQLRRHLHLN
jgi:hypothetical protein